MRDDAPFRSANRSPDAVAVHCLVTPRRPVEARAALVVFPYAGLGGSLAAGLSRQLDLPIAVHGVQLPGREARLSETPLTQMADVVGAVLPALAALAETPLILIGCSFGALIAYEVALRLAAMGTPPHCLVALACAAPHLHRRPTGLVGLADDEFVEAIDRQFGGVPDVIKQNVELQQLLLPALRADMKLFDSYRWSGPPRLDVPLLTIAGSRDRQVSEAELVAWGELTTALAEHRIIDGGHFVLRENPAAVAAILQAWLRRSLE
jgi:medium-chain acyl-[acyl-carrier-protein] hydrolase